MQPSDQAEGLRRMFSASAVRVLAVIGARPAMGATTTTVNLAAALARIGEDVLVLDAQGGSSGVCATLGVEAACDLHTALANDLPIETACAEIDGMRVLALPRAGAPAAVAEWRTIAALTSFAGRRDFVVVDAGDVSRGLQHLPFAHGRGEALVVLNRAASAITEGYAQLKRMVRERRMRRFMVLVNRVADEAQARAIHANMARVAAGHLDARLEYLGHVPLDERLGASRRRAGSTVAASPDCPAAQAFRRIAVALASEREEDISPRPAKGVGERAAGMRLRSINH